MPLYIPALGPSVPRTWGKLARFVGRLLLKVCNWRIEGEICNAPKFMLVMAPHTSWWDFTNNLGVMLATGIEVSWFIANKYTRWPLGTLIRYIGGVPVERSSRQDLVSQMVDHINGKDQFVLAIFPEGTRKKVTKWKTGFWYIATQSKLSVQVVSVDYKKRATIFGPVLDLSDDIDADIEKIQSFFQQATARYPAQFGGQYL